MRLSTAFSFVTTPCPEDPVVMCCRLARRVRRFLKRLFSPASDEGENLSGEINNSVSIVASYHKNPDRNDFWSIKANSILSAALPASSNPISIMESAMRKAIWQAFR